MSTTTAETTKLATLRDNVREAYSGQFMEPECYHGAFWLVDNEHGETVCIPADVCDPKLDELTAFADYMPYGEPVAAERKVGWLTRLSAAGYMDCTEYHWHDTEEEALQALLDDAPEA